VTAAELGNSVNYGFRRFPELRNSAFSYQNRKKPNLEVPLVDCLSNGAVCARFSLAQSVQNASHGALLC